MEVFPSVLVPFFSIASSNTDIKSLMFGDVSYTYPEPTSQLKIGNNKSNHCTCSDFDIA